MSSRRLKQVDEGTFEDEVIRADRPVVVCFEADY